MKKQLQTLFQHALDQLKHNTIIPADVQPEIKIDRCKDPKHGDFACNLAMLLAKLAKQKPRDLAEKLVAALPADECVASVAIAGPGFINITLTTDAQYAVVRTILRERELYGCSTQGAGQRVMVEFVSANPTGPLHVGHGRGAAYGAALANLLTIAGYNVHREYYVNDAGRQMDILAVSVWLRYLELCGVELTFPSNGYQGDYIWDIAASLHREHAAAFQHPLEKVLTNVPADASEGGDKEKHIDGLIHNAKQLLGAECFRDVLLERALSVILTDIQRDLEQFGVVYDQWFRERNLTDNNMIEHAIATLRVNNHVYEQDGALWFRSSVFGDEKDRVLIRENGLHTYFAADIAYHLNKIERGFDRLIDIWGADHHGYIQRVKASIQALGSDPNVLDIQLVQFVSLFRNNEKVQMSTRSGSFVTLRELREEVGNDAARFFYIQRKTEQHLDFDLDLAKSQSNDNPVYYVQYAHARICSVFREATEKKVQWQAEQAQLTRLETEHEQTLLTTLARYPEMIEVAARDCEPHQLTYYLRDLAQDFHTYYNAHKFIVDEMELCQARLTLVQAVQQVLQNGLAVIGVSAPEVM